MTIIDVGDFRESRANIERETMGYNRLNTDDEYRKALSVLLSGAVNPTKEDTRLVLEMVGYLPTTGINRYNPSRLKLTERESNGYLERAGRIS